MDEFGLRKRTLGSNLLWLGAEAMLTEALEDKGDLTWHIPLL